MQFHFYPDFNELVHSFSNPMNTVVHLFECETQKKSLQIYLENRPYLPLTLYSHHYSLFLGSPIIQFHEPEPELSPTDQYFGNNSLENMEENFILLCFSNNLHETTPIKTRKKPNFINTKTNSDNIETLLNSKTINNCTKHKILKLIDENEEKCNIAATSMLPKILASKSQLELTLNLEICDFLFDSISFKELIIKMFKEKVISDCSIKENKNFYFLVKFFLHKNDFTNKNHLKDLLLTLLIKGIMQKDSLEVYISNLVYLMNIAYNLKLSNEESSIKKILTQIKKQEFSTEIYCCIEKLLKIVVKILMKQKEEHPLVVCSTDQSIKIMRIF